MSKVKQPEQDLLEVRGDLARLAWEIGGRLMPCEFDAEKLIVPADAALAAALERLGARLRPFRGVFNPGAEAAPRHTRRHVQFHVARMHGDEGGEDDEAEAEAGPPAANA